MSNHLKIDTTGMNTKFERLECTSDVILPFKIHMISASFFAKVTEAWLHIYACVNNCHWGLVTHLCLRELSPKIHLACVLQNGCHFLHVSVTHLPLDKMAAISQTTTSSAFSLIQICDFFIQISLKFVPKGLIENRTALVQVMAWRRAGDRPLLKPMLTQFTDAYIRY